ncbi:penicillin acylase family protein [Pseudoalteromonas sp. TB41]|uniref:penicillin acylase family protein n=1 Tax=Pseudoalteromonas sp. TB41 TaxID=985149 RepID=UPI001300C0B5|nr:penicillin acylase family protein [Pseudoalteromonas sp. TB41]
MQHISSKVVVARDINGVANITGEVADDVYFATGFVHAQDRLWQLEVQRRMVYGKLSEIFGRSQLNTDIWIRTLGIYEAAERAWPHLSQEAKASLQAYTAGINEFIATDPTLPPEFTLLGIKPSTWTPIDSLAWAKMFALNLSNGMWSDLRRFAALQKFDEQTVEQLFPKYPKDSPVTVRKEELLPPESIAGLLDIRQTLSSDYGIGGEYVGSNAWVVAAKYTTQGVPILANDPHLGLQIPSLWYTLTQSSDALNAKGMSLVGLPIVVFGQNTKIAWGGTNMMADTQDLFVEQVNPENPKQYWDGEKWHPFDVRTEQIFVKPDFPAFLREPLKPVEVKIRKTHRGPIISDVVDSFHDQPISLRWTALDDEDTTYEAFYQLNYANNWQQFKDALKLYVAPTINMLYADEQNIGYVAAGRVPVRNKGTGNLPFPANDGFHWLGYIPFEDMPTSFNPDSGLIVSANNKIIGDDYPYFLSHDWAQPYRAIRIEEMLMNKLAEDGELDMEDMRTIQADQLNLGALLLKRVLTELLNGDADIGDTLSVVRDWNGEMTQDSVAATLFINWIRHIRQTIYQDELSAYWNQSSKKQHLEFLVQGVSYQQLLTLISSDRDQSWCDDINTEQLEDCRMIVKQALQESLKELTRLMGSDIEEWQWGKVQHAYYTHTPFSEVNILDSLFERSIHSGGSPNTINVASGQFTESDGYKQNFGAGFRQLIQLGAGPARHLYMNSTGQSGNVLSQHYDDMIKPFNRVEYFDLTGTESNEQGLSVLTLLPETNPHLDGKK